MGYRGKRRELHHPVLGRENRVGLLTDLLGHPWRPVRADCVFTGLLHCTDSCLREGISVTELPPVTFHNVAMTYMTFTPNKMGDDTWGHKCRLFWRRDSL